MSSLASELISKLAEEVGRHGDFEVMVYDNGTDASARDIDVEYNDDDPNDPVIMLSIDARDEQERNES